MRIPGPDPNGVTARLIDGLEEAEFLIAGQIVADIAVVGAPQARSDGSMEVAIEALTIAD